MSISSLLDISRQALNAQSSGIRIIGDNISNVNTPGYTRRRGEIVSNSATSSGTGPEIGTGVNLDRVVRIVDSFLNQELVARAGDRAGANIRNEFLKRAETAFRLDGQPGTIGYQLNDFFGSLQDLSASPANIPLRTQVLQKGQDLANTINQTYSAVAQLQREADDRVGILVSDVNRITNSISSVNDAISRTEIGTQEALTLRDQRDQLLNQLGEKINFRSLEDSSGKVTIYLSNGFTLVAGNQVYELAVTTTPSFAPPAGYPPGLDGEALSHIVYRYGGTSEADLTGIISSGSGELGGLLNLRGVQDSSDTSSFDAEGTLVEFAGRVEAITRDLLVRFNLEYRGPDSDTSSAGYTPSAYDLDGNQPGVYGLFSFAGAGAGNNLGDFDNDGLASFADLNSIVAAGTVSNFSSRLNFAVQSERAVAAARDMDLTSAASPYAQGDSSNLEALLTRRNTATSYSLGALSENTTIDGLYSLSVSYVGGASARAGDNLAIFKDREAQVKELTQSISGVNLDEEFAQLILFQKAFESAARLIRTSDDLMTQIIQLLG